MNSSVDGTSLDAIPALGGQFLYDELVVSISSSSKNMASYYLGAAMTLTGNTEDPGEYTSGNEDTLSYTWSSSLDGILGQGKDLDLSALTLSLGEHRITLEVVDPETGAWGAAALPNPIIVKGDMLPMS